MQKLFDCFRAHAGLKIVLIDLALIRILFFIQQLSLGQGRVAGIGYDIFGKVEDFLQSPGRDIEDQTHTGRNALEIPDMGNRSRQCDVTHPFAANLGTGNLYTALIADLAFVTKAFIFSAVAFPVLGRPKDSFTEQAVPFGFKRAVVDGFGLGDLAVRPFKNLFGGSQSDFDCFKRIKLHS